MGAGLAFIGLASLVFVVSEGESLGWTSSVILGTAILAIAALAWFVLHELGTADPLLDLHLFGNRNFFLTNLLLCLVFLSFSGINYLLPFYLEYVHSYDTSTAGLIMTSLSFAMMVAGLIAGVTFNRVGPRRVCILACIPLIIGYYLMTPAACLYLHRLCGRKSRPYRLRAGPDRHPGDDHDHDGGLKVKGGDDLEPDQP